MKNSLTTRVKIVHVAALIWSILGCQHPDTVPAEPTVMPEWTSEDCKIADGYYYFVGFGNGDDASAAMRAALISSRQNALACVFGGTINANVQVRESNHQVEFLSVTAVDLTYDHVNWAGYEQVPARIHFPHGDRHRVYSQYRWSLAQISVEQDRLKSLAKKIEENRALKKEVEASQKIADEKEVLIKAQKVELDRLKQHEQEVANLKSKKAKVLAELARVKKERNDKGREFVEMVTAMGCDVTYDDLVKLIGEPDEIKVRGVCYYACEYGSIAKHVPVLQYRYGEYGINAYVRGSILEGQADWDWIKKYKSEAQIVDIEKVQGSGKGWWICEEGYDFVKKLTRFKG